MMTIRSAFWGVAGFLAGLYIALQLAFPALNLGLEYTSFGRLRPLHTSAVIFAFGGNALIATSFWVVQRTSRARLAFPSLARFVFWGYQLFIVLAATGYLMGVTAAREYAEPEWYVDLWLTLVWVAYLVVFLGTIIKRQEPHIYVANWFFLGFIVTVAMLHIVNNLAVPVSLVGTKSYSLFAGVQDALTQWWYGHNAVGFFLTAGFLGMMYYFVPKQAERPVYSYRHLGRPPPPPLHGAARLGADAGHGLLDHAVDAELGRHDQRPHDPARGMGQGPHRSDHPHDGDLARLLRHGDFRGPDDVHQGRQLA
jgi:cytochrome c oxidase cbb3-type subunit I